jgi:hypothetical protein
LRPDWDLCIDRHRIRQFLSCCERPEGTILNAAIGGATARECPCGDRYLARDAVHLPDGQHDHFCRTCFEHPGGIVLALRPWVVVRESVHAGTRTMLRTLTPSKDCRDTRCGAVLIEAESGPLR